MHDIKQSKEELEKLCDFTEIFDQYRLVNPLTSEIYTLKDGMAVLSGEEPCYKIWNRTSPCVNCISMRTCLDQKQNIKLEYLDSRVHIVVAKPIVIGNRQFSLELTTDVTNSMFVQDNFHSHHEQTMVSELIQQVNRLSTRDIFTGLYNNAYIKNIIIALTQSKEIKTFSILIFDIDQFKLVNDRYGHLSGDTVIQTIALMLDKFSLMKGCSVGRMGGDEYCIVFENVHFDQAERYANETSEKISQYIYTGQSEDFFVDVSIGVGEYSHGEEAYMFISRVDQDLYKKKHIKQEQRLLNQ